MQEAATPLLALRASELVEGARRASSAVEERVKAEIADAVKFAEESPEPGAELLEPTTSEPLREPTAYPPSA